MATKCEACGTEIQPESANKSVLSMADRFKAIEAELKESGLTGTKLDAEIKLRRSREIRDFPVPNGRADLLSLLHYIAPRLDGTNFDPNIEDWRSKFREVTSLAKNSLKNDSKLRGEVEEIERSVQISMAGELKNRAKRSPIIAAIVGLVILAVLGGLVSVQLQKRAHAQCEEKYDQDAKSETIRLNGIFTRAITELKVGAYAEALASSSDLRWSILPDCKQVAASTMAAQWDQKRNELVNLVSAEEAKAVAERKVAEEKAAAERQAAEEKAAASEKAAEEKAAADEKAAAEKTAANERAAAEKEARKKAAAASKAATSARKAATDKEF